ncbi:uncharacterized protein BDZ99DRAFT_96684 [Mytilinidion resinicola]|uniref:Uncharacterized protein n=1 Tax=Mytilinidion resinicola TaxID=574789 RepID=A0A6A6YD37_9PEZI|nr:uncharacterized protein BDZ99DRAFT_96684 [Mytilinidion resinicola]KAF2806509.1 hypothetical protein BDZ99DRAFT_96684 [Mytilinidion resinicola]
MQGSKALLEIGLKAICLPGLISPRSAAGIYICQPRQWFATFWSSFRAVETLTSRHVRSLARNASLIMRTTHMSASCFVRSPFTPRKARISRSRTYVFHCSWKRSPYPERVPWVVGLTCPFFFFSLDAQPRRYSGKVRSSQDKKLSQAGRIVDVQSCRPCLGRVGVSLRYVASGKILQNPLFPHVANMRD